MPTITFKEQETPEIGSLQRDLVPRGRRLLDYVPHDRHEK